MFLTGDSNTQSWLIRISVVVVVAAAVCIILTNMKRERKRETVTTSPSVLHSCQYTHCSLSPALLVTHHIITNNLHKQITNNFINSLTGQVHLFLVVVSHLERWTTQLNSENIIWASRRHRMEFYWQRDWTLNLRWSDVEKHSNI